MRAAFVVLCLAVGCSYGPARSGGADDDAAAPADVAADSTTAPPTGCAIVPLGLVACYQLEDNFAGTTFTDGSGNNHDATASGFTAVMRDVPAVSQAAQASSTSSAIVAQAPDLELPGDFTLGVWIRPVNPSSSANEGIMDHEGGWAMSINFGELACWFTRPALTIISFTTFTNNAWQFVACRMNADQACTIHIAADTGTVTRECQTMAGAGSVGRNGISLGSFQDGGGAAVERFNGVVDDLRIYSRALTDAELCTLAGRASCQ